MMMIWDLGDKVDYSPVHSFEMHEAFTYGNMRATQRDIDKRRRIRFEAAKQFPKDIPPGQWWAFRIYVKKSGNRPFDIENVPKLIIDAFCTRQIRKDRQSEYVDLLGLYDDDTIEHVGIVEIRGERTVNQNSMMVSIFRRREQMRAPTYPTTQQVSGGSPNKFST